MKNGGIPMGKKVSIWLYALYMMCLLCSPLTVYGATTTLQRTAIDQMQKYPRTVQNFMNPKSDCQITNVTTPQQSTQVPIKQFLVQGKVISQDGSPRPGLIVKTFDRNVGVEDTLLGQATTDKQGNYLISYTLKSKPAADLVIKVYQDNQLLQESGIIFNATIKETKDFVIPVDEGPKFHIIKYKIDPLSPNKVVE
jgi:hypothetical protein